MYLDLNADVGESFGRWSLGDDDALLRVVTSANVACGFHAGDPATLLATCRTAVEQGVAVGAQVGYRDLAGFGRRFVDIAADDLYADVVYQVGALQGLARSVGGEVRYVKPHGALYNAIVHHEAQARAVVRACADTGLPLLGLPGARSLQLAQEAGVPTFREAFADRAYTPEGTLVPRTQAGAVLHDADADAIAARVVRLATEGVVEAIDGSLVPVATDSVCVHGDSPDAVAIATAVRAALTSADVELRPFA